MYVRYVDEKDLVNQISKMLSNLILIQSLPNANHRTAFFFMVTYAQKPGMRLKVYEEDTRNYDHFIKISKTIIDTDISHENFFNEKYIDAHHNIGIQKHLVCTRSLVEKILIKPQSGMRTVESFQSFIARLNHKGSLPSSKP